MYLARVSQKKYKGEKYKKAVLCIPSKKPTPYSLAERAKEKKKIKLLRA